jgi:hypothetical protein
MEPSEFQPRIPEFSYECAKAAYSLMRKYAQKLPSRTRDGPFQVIAEWFYEGTMKGDTGPISMVRACNRVLSELA